jgi:hypothetical protein
MQAPLLLALFDRRIRGNHHLLELAQRRFSDAYLGAEFNPTSLAQLQELLEFRPLTEPRYVIHLPRTVRLVGGPGVDAIKAFAARSRKDAYGLVLHDQPELARTPDAYIQAVRTLNEILLQIDSSPYVFIEYAVGVDFEVFVALFAAIKDSPRVSACIDIGHIGIRTVQLAYQQQHPQEDVCQLHPHHPALPEKLEDVISAAAAALPAVLDIIQRLGQLGKPLHFHVHDAHPLSTGSPYGISDHLSFLQPIQLPFPYQGQTTVPLLFGPEGVRQVVRTALDVLPREKLSFTLEIHPQDQRLSLGQYADLFQNWTDKRNAEQMNAWLELLVANQQCLLHACSEQA